MISKQQTPWINPYITFPPPTPKGEYSGINIVRLYSPLGVGGGEMKQRKTSKMQFYAIALSMLFLLWICNCTSTTLLSQIDSLSIPSEVEQSIEQYIENLEGVIAYTRLI